MNWNAVLRSLGVIACVLTGGGAEAQTRSLPAPQIPALVGPPSGINLGATSFYDGFSTLSPGVTLLTYLQYDHLTSITDSTGGPSPRFQNPRVTATTFLSQISGTTPLTIDGNPLGFDLVLPLTRLDSHFGPLGTQLRDNGTNLGDLTFGPFLQFKPVIVDGRPVASFRVAFDVNAPTGGFSRQRDLNQSSGFWSINPYVAWTVLPAPGWEVSGRTQYLYSFQTTNIPNAPTIPDFAFQNGKAGQLFYSNFTVSKEIVQGTAFGLNGYGLQQITNDRINDISLPNTKRSALYLGPGLHIDRLPDYALNLNVYVPVTTRNLATGLQLNAQLIVPLR